MDAAPALSAPETVSANLGTILRGLLAALGAWGMEPVLALALYRRIGGTIGRIERMLARFRAGRLWRAPNRAQGQRRCSRMAGRGPALPRRFGWLVQAGGYRAALVRSQLQDALNAPEMTALLAASAQAGRILRPLCRALAVQLPAMAATARKAATEPVETKRRGFRPRAAPEPFRIPLPRGALAAARREGFGKDR